MKKILLLISCLIISVATAFAATGQLNAYAYGAGYIYDANKQELAVSWSQQAEASAVRIVAVDADENRYPIKTYGKTGAGRHDKTIDLWGLIDAGLMPTNKNLRIEIEVKTADRQGHEVLGKNQNCKLTPYSIDIDNNPYSACFGLMYVTHMNSTENRGIQVLDQWGTDRGLKKDNTITYYGDWYYSSHGTPHMVRVIQDGSGRLLVTSSDRSQETHLWLVKPELDANNIPKLNKWNTVITSSDWKSASWTNHTTYGPNDKIANAAIDIRENGNNWDILLLAASFNSTTDGHSAGQAYSGVYQIAKDDDDLKGGTYTALTKPKIVSGKYEDHDYVGDEYVGSTLTANANFDKYGGVFYNAHTEETERGADDPSLIHRTPSGNYKRYTDGNYLKRKNLATKGVRFNQDFTKIAIAQGKNMTNELRIYDVSQSDGNSHPSFKNGVNVDLVANSTAKAYVHDIAWDYAQNIYVAVRNSSSPGGLYVVATDIGDKAIITPAGGTPFRVECDANTTYNISLVQSGGTGTLEGGGYYASCSKVTIVAKPDNQYKFVAWKEGDAVVSTNSTYSFYVTKDRTLTAVFEGAVYNNITWWNLFENGQDVEDPNANYNERLWRLLQVEYNKYSNGTKNTGTQKDVGMANSMYKVYAFFQPAQNTLGKNSTTIYTNVVENFMERNANPVGWIGRYIENLVDKDVQNTANYNFWAYFLQSFINRKSTFYYANCTSAPQTIEGYTCPDFSTYGQISSWRPYWTDKVCGLPSTRTYNDPMPTNWTKDTCSTGSIAGITPSNWYKWNKVNSPQNNGTSDRHILAWRKDGVKGPIITRVEENNLRLYATYVKKHIQEDDPTPDMSGTYPQDATNSDVFRLLFNKTWANNNYAHKLTITRKIQGGMYNTICFPFTVYLGKNGSMPDGNQFKNAKYYAYTSRAHSAYNESGEPVTILEFAQVTDVLHAGVPYLIYSENDITQEEVLFGNEDSQSYKSVIPDTVPKTVTFDTKSEVKIDFVGTINPTEVPAGSLILVANNRLALTTAPGKMNGMRGYFYIHPSWASDIAEQAADGRVYLSLSKPTTTSIPVAPEAEQQTKPEVRKIMRDGQIYILRGDEVYTITGHRVR